jgi:hypothetical protein
MTNINNLETAKAGVINSIVADNGNTSANGANSKCKNTKNSFLDILRKSRTIYKRQIIRDAQMKKSAIEHILKLTDKDRNQDDVVFRATFHDVVHNRLLDSNRFVDACKNMRLNPLVLLNKYRY